MLYFPPKKGFQSYFQIDKGSTHSLCIGVSICNDIKVINFSIGLIFCMMGIEYCWEERKSKHVDDN